MVDAALHVLGVDGGNTKTVALVARGDGMILGAAEGGCADVYGAASEGAALTEIQETSLKALAQAGLEPQTLDRVAFSLAGADWPEDHELYRSELSRGLGLQTTPLVVNDAIGGLWAGSHDGIGVSVVCGTAGAVGGRGRDGRLWHASFWIGSSGGIELARSALRAANRATFGIDPPTSLTVELPEFFGEPTSEAMLHRLTRRNRDVGSREIARAAPVVLAAAEHGDVTARRLVAECGAQLGDFAVVAAREVGLLADAQPFRLVLAGGVLHHPSPLLHDAIVDRVARSAPRARPVLAALPPAAGALLLALHDAGVATHERVVQRVRTTLGEFEALAPLGRR